ncbi:MAG TPA: GNAT family N-acetyltransferase [Polyangia bacterium]|nr:GNAT family N-acetyltransferase [Polyangia bacterium]
MAGPALISTVVTYLEMREPPSDRPTAPLRDDLQIVHARKPTVSFYRYLYDTIGERWLWTDRSRKKLSDAELAAILGDERVEVWVLYAAGVPAGYVELDRRVGGEIEVAYFGLIPEFVGQGLGAYLLDWAIHRAWAQPRLGRLWVHTQTLDHPRALPLYQRLGFKPYKTETIHVDDPR